jgi:Flp pilus assembly protein TadB
MPKYVPVQRPDIRVIPYVDPAQPAAMQLYTAQELAQRRAQDRVLYARWQLRQAEYAERDRKVRKFMLGFAAAFAAVAVVAVGLLVWLAYTAIVSIGAGLLLVPLALVALAGVAFGGHRCVTIVQHWH